MMHRKKWRSSCKYSLWRIWWVLNLKKGIRSDIIIGYPFHLSLTVKFINIHFIALLNNLKYVKIFSQNLFISLQQKSIIRKEHFFSVFETIVPKLLFELKHLFCKFVAFYKFNYINYKGNECDDMIHHI